MTSPRRRCIPYPFVSAADARSRSPLPRDACSTIRSGLDLPSIVCSSTLRLPAGFTFPAKRGRANRGRYLVNGDATRLLNARPIGMNPTGLNRGVGRIAPCDKASRDPCMARDVRAGACPDTMRRQPSPFAAGITRMARRLPWRDDAALVAGRQARRFELDEAVPAISRRSVFIRFTRESLCSWHRMARGDRRGHRRERPSFRVVAALRAAVQLRRGGGCRSRSHRWRCDSPRAARPSRAGHGRIAGHARAVRAEPRRAYRAGPIGVTFGSSAACPRYVPSASVSCQTVTFSIQNRAPDFAMRMPR